MASLASFLFCHLQSLWQLAGISPCPSLVRSVCYLLLNLFMACRYFIPCKDFFVLMATLVASRMTTWLKRAYRYGVLIYCTYSCIMSSSTLHTPVRSHTLIFGVSILLEPFTLYYECFSDRVFYYYLLVVYYFYFFNLSIVFVGTSLTKNVFKGSLVPLLHTVTISSCTWFPVSSTASIITSFGVLKCRCLIMILIHLWSLRVNVWPIIPLLFMCSIRVLYLSIGGGDNKLNFRYNSKGVIIFLYNFFNEIG